MKINVVGGGPAGLYAALLMKKLNRGDEITVFERDPAHNTYGWGIVLSQRTMSSLRGADFDSYTRIAEAGETWKNVDVVHKGKTITVRGNVFSGIQRIRFLSILHERCRDLGVELRFETDISDLDSILDCHLLVGADGLKSTVREKYKEAFNPATVQRHNKYIWLGTPKPFHALTMMFRQHKDGLYIAHAYRFEPDMSTFVVECDPNTWLRAGLDQLSESETCDALAEVFEEELDGKPLYSNASDWANFLIVKNRHWFHENVVLLGDALHTVHFSIGSGTKLAVEDAIALTGAFAENESVQSALESFEKRRKPRVDAFQDAALDSLLWLENVEQDIHLEPIAFAHRLMTRSNRVGHRRLKEQDPEFMRRYEAWRWEHEGPIHADFLDLFEKKAYAHVATLLADGKPHVTPIWVDYDGEHILLNSSQGRQKDVNMQRRRQVAVEISDPENPNRYISIMGEVVGITEEGAEDHLNKLAKRYLEKDRYPPSWRYPGEIRRIYKIQPHKVIHWDPFGGW